MKTRLRIAAASIALLPATGPAQYAINWHTFSGGGAVSGEGSYLVAASVGRTDSGRTLKGGSYVLDGGFWSIHAVVGPWLSIARNPDGTLSIIWPSHLSDHVLQESPDLTEGSWSPSFHPVSDNGVFRSITFTPASGRRFFRLEQ